MGVILSLLECQIKTFGRMQIPEFMPKKHVQVSPLYFKIKMDSRTSYINISFLYLISIYGYLFQEVWGNLLIREGFN